MGTPSMHCKSSVLKFKGSVNDYEKIHNFLDSSKFGIWSWQHRALYHHTEGIKLCELLFGKTIINSDGIEVDTREIAALHIIEDCTYVPTVKDWLQDLPVKKFAINLNKTNNEN